MPRIGRLLESFLLRRQNRIDLGAQFINLLLDLKKELSLTYLFISHDLNLVGYVSDRIGVMFNGRLVELAATDEMMNNPCHPYTLKLFSSVPGKQAVDQAADKDNSGRAEEKLTALPAAGCPYADQCPAEDHGCRQALPELRELKKGHYVACFRT